MDAVADGTHYLSTTGREKKGNGNRKEDRCLVHMLRDTKGVFEVGSENALQQF